MKSIFRETRVVVKEEKGQGHVSSVLYFKRLKSLCDIQYFSKLAAICTLRIENKFMLKVNAFWKIHCVKS